MSALVEFTAVDGPPPHFKTATYAVSLTAFFPVCGYIGQNHKDKYQYWHIEPLCGLNVENLAVIAAKLSELNNLKRPKPPHLAHDNSYHRPDQPIADDRD